MRKMKKLASLLLALVMVLSLSVTAMADDPTYTITIKYEASGHTYEAYQIFTGDLSGSVLSNVEWGSGVDSGALVTALKAASGEQGNALYGLFDVSTDGYYTAAKVAEIVAGFNSNSDEAEEFAQIVSKNLSNTAAGSSADNTITGPDANNDYTYTISDLKAGYYLVKDKDGSVTTDGSTYTEIILQVVKNVEVTAKASTTTLDKTITGTTTDASVTTGSKGDTTADYSVGDDVPFALTATLPSTYDDYDTYELVFHDTLSNGLSFNKDVVVTVYEDSSDTVGTVVDSSFYTVVTDCYHEVSITDFVSGTTYYTENNGTYSEVADTTGTPDADTIYYVKADCSFEVQIDDTKVLKDKSGDAITVTKDSIIKVTYSAELLNSAATTHEETNEAYLEYSNNPNDTGTGSTGTTTEDKTTVFVFTLNLDKVDEDKNPLEGAGFTLHRKVSVSAAEFDPATTTYYTVANGTWTEVVSNATYDSRETYYEQVSTATAKTQYAKVTTITAFETGVTYYTTSDNVTYSEVTDTSSGPVSGTDYYVEAANLFSFEGLGTGDYVLVETVTPSGYNTMDDYYFAIKATTQEDSTGASVTELKIVPVSGNEINGSTSTKIVETNIENKSGSTLPSTGGIGTTIFYVIGTIMVLGAAVVLITRRRMSSAK